MKLYPLDLGNIEYDEGFPLAYVGKPRTPVAVLLACADPRLT
jgi:hypothetical protein